ncbi:MAG: RND family transporter, partial [Planctomycetaceae bacterium]
MFGPSHPWLDRSIAGLVRQRNWLFLIAALLTLLALPAAFRLTFDQSIEALYAHDNPRLRDYRDSRRLFGGDELILVAWLDPELYDAARDEFRAERLAPIKEVANELSQVDGVDAKSTQDLASTVGRAQALRRIPGLGAIERRVRSLSHGILLSENNQTTAVVLRLAPAAQVTVSRAETIRQVREVARRFALRTGLQPHVVGEPVQVHDMFRYVEDDGFRLGLWSSLLLLAVIFALFRNLRWTVVPVAVVWATIVWTRAVLVLLDLRLSMVSSMLTSLVTIIGVATVIHIAVRYQELRLKLPPEGALREALAQLAPAIFWTCATTAAGFGAQLSSHIHPVASFGLMMSVGTMLVLPALGCLVPAGALSGPWPVDPRPAPAASAVARGLERLAWWVE